MRVTILLVPSNGSVQNWGDLSTRESIGDSNGLTSLSVDPEACLVDWTNIDVDLSADIDEKDLRGLDAPNEDKVLVSVR